MRIAVINSNDDHSRYIEQIYEEYYAKLQKYFLTQLGDVSEAHDSVQETIRRFFFFMEERHWEAEAEFIPVYLMRIAGLLCSRRLAEKRSQAHIVDGNENNSFFNRIRTQTIQTIKERIQFKQLFLSPKEGNSELSSMA